MSGNQRGRSGSRSTDGRQSRWTRHNAERRAAVLDAAVAVIEDSPPGAEVPVQAIADRAGLSRTVLYRHFDDRADLDRAIAGRIFEDIRGALLPVMSFDGTPVQIIRRIVGAYVGWAAGHPALHRVAEQQPPGIGSTQLDEALGQLAEQIETLITIGVEVLDVRMDQDTRDALDPLVFGLIGAGFTAVRRWLARPERVPEAEAFVDLITEAIWLQIQGMARVRGVELDPDLPVEELLASLEAHS